MSNCFQDRERILDRISDLLKLYVESVKKIEQETGKPFRLMDHITPVQPLILTEEEKKKMPFRFVTIEGGNNNGCNKR